MRLQDIAEANHCPSSTALRFLSTLMSMGYVSQSSDKRYALTLKFALIGKMVASNIDIHSIAHPYLVELVQKCHESACLAIEQNQTVIYADVVNGPDGSLRTTQYIGKSAPMHCTGVGKLMLTNYSEKQIDQFIEAKGLPVFTPNTICSKEHLMIELDKIRRLGYAYDNEECEIGARCIAAPLYDYTGKVIACISISGPVIRINPKRADTLLPLLLETAQAISEKLGYNSVSE